MLALLATAVTSANALDGAAACPGSKVFIEMGQGFTILGHNRVKGISNAANQSNFAELSIPVDGENEGNIGGSEGSMAWPWVDGDAVAAVSEGGPDVVERQGYLVDPAAIQKSGTSGLGYNVYGTLGYDAKIGCTLLGVFAGGGYLGSGTNLSVPASTAVFNVADEAPSQEDGAFPATAVMPANYTLRMRSAGYVTAGLRLGYIFNKNVVGMHAAWVGLSMKAGLTGPGMTKNTVPGNSNANQGPVAVKTVSRFTNGVNLGIFFERMVSQNLTLGLALNYFLMGKKTYNFGSQNINWAPNTPDTSLAFNNRFRAFSVAVTAKYTLPMSR
ncbi:MAG: hypothetical protein BGO07_01050 [Alphaproteobacteria bacterium 40-19]|nr:MAG: hypothetical protein BGO07_01050 [Alphaproteobacteria bacterium 40-19]